MPELPHESGSENRRQTDDVKTRQLHFQTKNAVRKWLTSSGNPFVSPNKKWVLAISGGPDSVALLHVLMQCFPSQPIVLAHMNHHARDGSDADEEFVRQLAIKHDLPIEIGHWQPIRTTHFEVDARIARLKWLRSVALQHQSSAVFTAHTLDDQAETLLMRMARGTGPTGMAGIRPWRHLEGTQADLVRPFLKIPKSKILSYLTSSKIPFCNDPTNLDEDHQTRAWVRQSLIPLIQNRLNPQFTQALGRLADLAREEQDELGQIILERLQTCTVLDRETNTCRIQIRRFRKAGSARSRRQILRKIWLEMCWPMREMSFQHWVRLNRWLFSKQTLDGSVYQLPGHIQATRSGMDVSIQLANPATPIFPDFDVDDPKIIPFDWPGRVVVDQWDLQATPFSKIPQIGEIVAMEPSMEAVIDPEKVIPPVFLKHPADGEKFDPLGLSGHHQKLVDFLRILGVSNHLKKQTWVMYDQIGVIWVVGHRIADRVKITPESRSAWHLTNAMKSDPAQ